MSPAVLLVGGVGFYHHRTIRVGVSLFGHQADDIRIATPTPSKAGSCVCVCVSKSVSKTQDQQILVTRYQGRHEE